MKKKALFIMTVIVLTLTAVFAVGCKDKDGFKDLEYYDFEDFITLKNFTVKFSQEKNTVGKYDNDGSEIKFMTDTTDEEGVNNKIYYSFAAEGSKINIGGEWQIIETDDVDDYLSSIADRTGLSYTKIQETYLTEKSDRIYAVDPDHFFKELFRQKYESYFGKDYEENEFAAEYENQKEEIFGNIDDYMVTLDFSEKKQIKLTIVKHSEDEEKQTSEFIFTDIGTTKVDLPKEE